MRFTNERMMPPLPLIQYNYQRYERRSARTGHRLTAHVYVVPMIAHTLKHIPYGQTSPQLYIAPEAIYNSHEYQPVCSTPNTHGTSFLRYTHAEACITCENFLLRRPQNPELNRYWETYDLNESERNTIWAKMVSSRIQKFEERLAQRQQVA